MVNEFQAQQECAHVHALLWQSLQLNQLEFENMVDCV